MWGTDRQWTDSTMWSSDRQWAYCSVMYWQTVGRLYSVSYLQCWQTVQCEILTDSGQTVQCELLTVLTVFTVKLLYALDRLEFCSGHSDTEPTDGTYIFHARFNQKMTVPVDSRKLSVHRYMCWSNCGRLWENSGLWDRVPLPAYCPAVNRDARIFFCMRVWEHVHVLQKL